ncbi:hypothetical protein [Nonomuraea zeae]|uniref:Fibronectin type-III domain-containing protein n=1 Tax=Nonomuraea zeae TaxID=1642303 RepID=A0A5S4FBY2_9ACTN|nr:hypothetical protein [Nonomuraea zeae]TMR15279.1 hypothetical protein ETD85_56230 [Nonomuraea zeae]
MTVVGRVVAAGMIVAGSIMLGSGSAQAAVAVQQAGSAGQITSPSDGQVVSGSSVTISARTGLMQLRMGLYVEGPSTPSQKVAGGGANQEISGTFDAGSAPNGTFTVTLKGEITQTRYASSTFKLRRPAEAPGNVNASLQGTTKVVVTWSRGSEPDLQSYEVSNSQSGIVGRLAADSACSGSSCKATLAVPSKAAGQKVGFTVQAFRGDGDGGSIGSGNSAAAYITFPAPPAAQPKKTTSTQQTPKNKDTKSVDALPTLPAKKQTLPTSKPTAHKPKTSKLPQIPDTDAKGNLPIPTADTSTGDQDETDGLAPAGTKDGTKDGAKDDTEADPVQTSDVKAQSSESPMGNIGQYGLYVAGGLLLLLLGAHAGAWARRRALASSPGGPAPGPVAPAPASAAVSPPGETVPATKPVNESAPHGGTTPRRPAVILAVAKTRVPAQSHAQEAPATRQPSSADRPSSAHQLASTERSASPHQSASADRLASPHELAAADRPLSAHQSVSAERPSSGYDLASAEQSPSRDQAPSGNQATSAHQPSSAGQSPSTHQLASPYRPPSGYQLTSADRLPSGYQQASPSQPPSAHRPPPSAQQLTAGQLTAGQLTAQQLTARQSAAQQPFVAEQPETAQHPEVLGQSTVTLQPASGQEQASAAARLGVQDLRPGQQPASVPRPSAGDVPTTPQRVSSDEQGAVAQQSGSDQQSTATQQAASIRQQPADALRSTAAQHSGGVAPGGQSSGDTQGRGEVPVALPRYLDVEGEARGPVRISLPSSAVTDVPASAATPVTPPAVRIEDRWDDYLPPSPRSMEDSGFWERPQPGSADFWAADSNEDGGEQAYASRRRGDGDS